MFVWLSQSKWNIWTLKSIKLDCFSHFTILFTIQLTSAYSNSLPLLLSALLEPQACHCNNIKSCTRKECWNSDFRSIRQKWSWDSVRRGWLGLGATTRILCGSILGISTLVAFLSISTLTRAPPGLPDMLPSNAHPASWSLSLSLHSPHATMFLFSEILNARAQPAQHKHHHCCILPHKASFFFFFGCGCSTHPSPTAPHYPISTTLRAPDFCSATYPSFFYYSHTLSSPPLLGERLHLTPAWFSYLLMEVILFIYISSENH